MDECASQPCQSGGRCLNSLSMYNCLCPEQFTGINCERREYFVFLEEALNYIPKRKQSTGELQSIHVYQFLTDENRDSVVGVKKLSGGKFEPCILGFPKFLLAGLPNLPNLPTYRNLNH